VGRARKGGKERDKKCGDQTEKGGGRKRRGGEAVRFIS
jgi:hypothetical protein